MKKKKSARVEKEPTLKCLPGKTSSYITQKKKRETANSEMIQMW